MTIRIKGDAHEYQVMDGKCIGRPCLNLHPVQIMGAIGAAGKRFTGSYRYCCGRRDYHGCPQPLPEYEPELAKTRQQQGMSLA